MYRHRLMFAATAALVFCAESGFAGFTDLGNNWLAEWDDSLDPFVDVLLFGTMPTPDGLAIVIRKEAEFTQPSVGGVFPSIPIVFRQTGPSDVEFIVIEDDVVTNSTGEDWFDFHMQLVDGGDALFDPTRTMDSGGAGPIGWDISPFTQAEFSADNRELDIFGGSIANGETWTAGFTAPGEGGALWIDVVSSDSGPFTLFTLKETPTIPTPASIALLALAGIAALPRRSRRANAS